MRLIILYESGTYAVRLWEAEKSRILHIFIATATLIVTVGKCRERLTVCILSVI